MKRPKIQTAKVLGENPYTKLSNTAFLVEFDSYMKSKDFDCSLSIYAVFSMAFLVEYDRRFRPKGI